MFGSIAIWCVFLSVFLLISIFSSFADTVIFLTSLSGSRKKKYSLFLVTCLLQFPPPRVGHIIAITHQGRALLCTTGLKAGIPLPSHSNASSCSTKSTCWNCPYSAHEIPWKTHNCQSFSYHCHSNSYQPGFLLDCLPESHKAVNIHHV